MRLSSLTPGSVSLSPRLHSAHFAGLWEPVKRHLAAGYMEWVVWDM